MRMSKYIQKFIQETRFSKWNSRSQGSGHFKRIINDIRNLLIHVSGGDLNNLLDDLSMQKSKYHKDDRCLTALKNFAKISNYTKPKEKHHFIRAMRMSNYTLKEVKELGFECSKHLWQSSIKTDAKRDNGGRKPISENLIKCIGSFMKGWSNIASNRTVKIISNGYKIDECVRYSKTSIAEAYLSFPQRNEISFATFCKYISKIYKKPFRWTDLCDYCEHGLKLKKKLIKIARDNNFFLDLNEEFNENKYFKDMGLFFKRKADFQTLELVNNYMEILFHKYIASVQRNSYNDHRKNAELLKNSLVIVCDFKQKIKIGIDIRQVNTEYFGQDLRSCFSFGIYYMNVQDQITCINFDVISNLNQSAETVVKYFKFLREQAFFQDIDKENYTVWMDAGTQFKSNELCDYFFVELANSKIKVNLNFFGEKHGKNCRDTHFSVISSYIKREASLLKSSEDVANAINNKQAISNKIRELTGRDPIIVIAKPYYDNSKKRQDKIINIPDIRTYYNLKTNDNYEIKTTILSSLKIEHDVEFGEPIVIEKRNELSNEKILETENTDIRTLEKRRSKITQLIRKNLDSQNANLLDYSIEDEGEEENDAVNMSLIDKNDYCRDNCSSCNSLVSFRIKDLLKERTIHQNKIRNELKAHGHPMSRKIGNKQRDINQTKQELINHYVRHHSN